MCKALTEVFNCNTNCVQIEAKVITCPYVAICFNDALAYNSENSLMQGKKALGTDWYKIRAYKETTNDGNFCF